MVELLSTVECMSVLVWVCFKKVLENYKMCFVGILLLENILKPTN